MTKQEREQRVIALVLNGAKFTEAAAELGITKGSVAGIVFRARKSGKMPDIQRQIAAEKKEVVKRHRKKRRRYFTRLIEEAMKVEADGSLISPYDGEKHLHIMDLTARSCRYPMGYGNDQLQRFCGHTAPDVAKPYCPTHHKLVYTPVRGYAKPVPHVNRASMFMGK